MGNKSGTKPKGERGRMYMKREEENEADPHNLFVGEILAENAKKIATTLQQDSAIITQVIEHGTDILKKDLQDPTTHILRGIFDLGNMGSGDTQKDKQMRILLAHIFIHDIYGKKVLLSHLNKKQKNPIYKIGQQIIESSISEEKGEKDKKEPHKTMKQIVDNMMKKYKILNHKKSNNKGKNHDWNIINGQWYVRNHLQNILFADFMVDILGSPEDPGVITIGHQRYQIYIADSFLDRKVGIDIVLENTLSGEKIYIDRSYSQTKSTKTTQKNTDRNNTHKDIIILPMHDILSGSHNLNNYVQKYIAQLEGRSHNIKYTGGCKNRLQNLLLEHIQKSEEHNS